MNFLILILALVLAFLPTVLAFIRRHPSKIIILTLNIIFLMAFQTVVGALIYIALLVWASWGGQPKRVTVS